MKQLRERERERDFYSSEVGDAVPITDQGEFLPLQGPSRTVVGTKADGSTSSARHDKNLPGNESSLKIATKKPAKKDCDRGIVCEPAHESCPNYATG